MLLSLVFSLEMVGERAVMLTRVENNGFGMFLSGYEQESGAFTFRYPGQDLC